MTVLVLSSVVPSRRDDREGVTAVHIQVSELLRALQRRGLRLVLQVIFHASRPSTTLTPDEAQELVALQQSGIRLWPPLTAARHATTRSPSRLGRLTLWVERLIGISRLEAYYPALRHRARMVARCREAGIDAAVAVISPEGVAAMSGVGLPLVAFQGDVDSDAGWVRWRDPALFAAARTPRGWRGRLGRLMGWLWLRGLERAHRRLMRHVDSVVNTSAVNAACYHRHGHRRSIYSGTTWRDATRPPGASRAQETG